MKTNVSLLLVVLVCFVSGQAQVDRGKRSELKSIPKPSVAANMTNPLPIRRVILYSNGVAYFERR